MKKGINFHLKVCFSGLNVDDVEKIEFLFSKNKNSKILKNETFPGNVEKESDTNCYLIPFSNQETYMFPSNFLMDTRITLKGTTDQPQTNIVELNINDTLFEREVLNGNS